MKPKWRTQFHFGRDKVLHYFAGLLFAGALLLSGCSAAEALTGAVVLGIGKEVYDATGVGTPDIWDVVFTIIGGIAAIFAFWLMRKVKENGETSN